MVRGIPRADLFDQATLRAGSSSAAVSMVFSWAPPTMRRVMMWRTRITSYPSGLFN